MLPGRPYFYFHVNSEGTKARRYCNPLKAVNLIHSRSRYKPCAPKPVLFFPIRNRVQCAGHDVGAQLLGVSPLPALGLPLSLAFISYIYKVGKVILPESFVK